MATYKILGFKNPGTTNTILYSAPAGYQTVVSTIWITNTGTTAGTFRLYGISDTTSPTYTTANQLANDVPIPANSIATFTAGITLAANQGIGVYASTSNIVFSAFGSEIEV